MRLAFKDSLFDAQLLRTTSHSNCGAADIGECLATAAQIREPDGESWYAAWNATAERIDAAARMSLRGGHRASALSGFLRASNYFRTSYTFLIGAPVEPRVLAGYRKQRTAFEAAIALLAPVGERIEIPYENSLLHGYFFRAANNERRRPTLIINGGYDSTAEEAFMFSGAAAVARGYNCVVFDGPGQGAAIIEKGVGFRPDWENVITPVVDFVLARAEVDATRLALMGISFGGYLAPRAASCEARLAALIADPGELSLFDEMKGRLPGFIAKALEENRAGFAMSLFRFILNRRMKHTTAGWGIRRGMWVHGVATPLDYMMLTRDYHSHGRAAQIHCPTLVTHAENDDIGATARALFEALPPGNKQFLEFAAGDGAGEHCEVGARLLFNQRAFDWLDATLGLFSPGVVASSAMG